MFPVLDFLNVFGISLLDQPLSFLSGFFVSFAASVWFMLRVYLLLVDLRILVSWCLNINPYFEPFETLWFITDPVFLFGRKLYPKFLGLESAPFYNIILLHYLVSFLDRRVHGMDFTNYSKFISPHLVNQPRMNVIDPNQFDRFSTFGSSLFDLFNN